MADVVDYGDVGEKVVVLCGRHRFPQRFIGLEVTYQDAKAVQVRMLRRDDLKNGLSINYTCLNELTCDKHETCLNPQLKQKQ